MPLDAKTLGLLKEAFEIYDNLHVEKKEKESKQRAAEAPEEEAES